MVNDQNNENQKKTNQTIYLSFWGENVAETETTEWNISIEQTIC